MYIIEISHVIAHYTSIYSKNKTFDSTQIFLIIIIYTFFKSNNNNSNINIFIHIVYPYQYQIDTIIYIYVYIPHDCPLDGAPRSSWSSTSWSSTSSWWSLQRQVSEGDFSANRWGKTGFNHQKDRGYKLINDGWTQFFLKRIFMGLTCNFVWVLWVFNYER